MALAFTTPADVRSRWIGEFDFTDEQVTTFLEDAEDAMLAEFADIPVRVEQGTLPIGRVRKVAARMVIRYLRNPEGIQQTSTNEGPFGESRSYGGDALGAIALTDQDRDDLAPASVGVRAFMIDTAPVQPTTYSWSQA